MKVFNFIYGFLTLILAAICFIDPFGSQLMYGYIISIFVGVMGIASIIAWYQTRKMLKATGIAAATGAAGLIIGIVGIVFMLLNMTVPFFTYSVQEFGVVVAAFFVLVEGISLLASAITNRTRTTFIMRVIMGVLGALMIIAFIQALMFPAIVIGIFGIFLGVAFAIQGISRITLAISL